MYYLICYDVSENKSRTKMMKYLKNEGFHIQKSVFIVKSDALRAETIYNDLCEHICIESDTVLMTPMCQHCVKKMLTSPRLGFRDDVWIV